MSSDFYLGFMCGGCLITGVVITMLIVTGSKSESVWQERLDTKTYIKMHNCYAQYSAVRRFPR